MSRIRAIGVREAERVADEALRLAGLRVQTGLRLPDCCALLAAEANGADLATFDTRLAESARSHGLTVIEP